MKTIKTIYSEILSNVSPDDIINALSGSCNLTATYLNDYSSRGINEFVAEFLHDNANKLDVLDIECILENPDHIIQSAASVFLDCLSAICTGYYNEAHNIIKSNTWFDSVGEQYFVYANPWSNACTDYFLIRATNESEAMNELLTRFESKFLTDLDDSVEQTFNDNGNPVDIDNLVIVGSFEFVKA